MVALSLFLALLAAVALHAQPVVPSALSAAAPDWDALAITLPRDERTALIDAVFRNQELALLDKRQPSVLRNLHIVHVDLDGKPDVVYHGTNGSDIKRLVVFRSTEAGPAVVLAQWGELVAVERSGPFAPLSFTIVDYPCCAGYTLYLESYSPVYTADSLRYALASRTAYTITTDFPASFTRRTPFVVRAGTTDLRAMPRVSAYQPQRYNGVLPNPGNLLGVYPAGTAGVVLAEESNTPGDQWYFVLLFRTTPVEQDILHKGQNHDDTTGRFGMLGWLRADDIQLRE